MIKREKRDELHIEQSKSACCQSFWDFSRALLCSVMFTLGFNILLFSIFKSLSVSAFTVTGIAEDSHLHSHSELQHVRQLRTPCMRAHSINAKTTITL